jgi:hypothetical protein
MASSFSADGGWSSSGSPIVPGGVSGLGREIGDILRINSRIAKLDEPKKDYEGQHSIRYADEEPSFPLYRRFVGKTFGNLPILTLVNQKKVASRHGA